jgi:hypothetical protein
VRSSIAASSWSAVVVMAYRPSRWSIRCVCLSTTRKSLSVRLGVREFWETWTTDPLWLRPVASTNIHNPAQTHLLVREALGGLSTGSSTGRQCASPNDDTWAA